VAISSKYGQRLDTAIARYLDAVLGTAAIAEEVGYSRVTIHKRLQGIQKRARRLLGEAHG